MKCLVKKRKKVGISILRRVIARDGQLNLNERNLLKGVLENHQEIQVVKSKKIIQV